MDHCKTLKKRATRHPFIGSDSDWVIEEDTNIFLGSLGRGVQTELYPYNQVFEIEIKAPVAQ